MTLTTLPDNKDTDNRKAGNGVYFARNSINVFGIIVPSLMNNGVGERPVGLFNPSLLFKQKSVANRTSDPICVQDRTEILI